MRLFFIGNEAPVKRIAIAMKGQRAKNVNSVTKMTEYAISCSVS